jgi:regulator of replication initiation timing
VKKDRHVDASDFLKQNMNDIIEKRANSQSLMKENKRLDEDNEDLRQSALDGVDIA